MKVYITKNAKVIMNVINGIPGRVICHITTVNGTYQMNISLNKAKQIHLENLGDLLADLPDA